MKAVGTHPAYKPAPFHALEHKKKKKRSQEFMSITENKIENKVSCFQK